MDLVKKEIRAEIKAKLKTISPKVLEERNRKISKNLRNLILELGYFCDQSATSHQSYIGGYAPFFPEIQWNLELNDWGAHFAFPLCLDDKLKKMVFIPSTFDSLVPCKMFGRSIMVPEKAKPIVTPDLLILPGLSADLRGTRLGRGAGYYDRYLESYKGIKIFPCYQEQLFQEIPEEKHDIRVDFIIYENGVIKINQNEKL